MGGYKEHKILDMLARKSTIIQYIVFIVLIFIVTIAMIGKAIQATKIEEVIYTGNSKLDYKVYLKANEFFSDRYLEKDNHYITSLIDYIDVDFNYTLDGSKEDVEYEYAYKIVAETIVEDKDSNKPLFDSKEELVKEKKFQFNTNSQLKINETLKIDYNKYNDLINKFVDVYDLNNIKSAVTVNMYVKIIDETSNTDYEEKNPTMSVCIPLTMQTMAIDIETNEIRENTVSLGEKINTEKYIFAVFLLFIIDILLVIRLVMFIKDTKDEKSIYNMRIKRIMSNYGSYVQKLNNDFDFEGYQILEIKSFEDLLQIKETINKPILMREKLDALETYFFISSENTIYLYELKSGYLRKNRGKRHQINDEELTF